MTKEVGHMDVDNNVINYLSVRLRGFFAGWENISDIREIRLRTGREATSGLI